MLLIWTEGNVDALKDKGPGFQLGQGLLLLQTENFLLDKGNSGTWRKGMFGDH